MLADVGIPRIGVTTDDHQTFRLTLSLHEAEVAAEVACIELALDAFTPDVLLTNQICRAAVIVSERHDVPACVLTTAEDVGGADGLAPGQATFVIQGDRFLLRSAPDLDPLPTPLPDAVRYVGVCDWEPFPDPARSEIDSLLAIKQGQPLIYVDHRRRTVREARFWSQLVEALHSAPVTVCARIPQWDRDPSALPSNFLVSNALPRAVALARARLAIATAKSSTLLSAAAAGIPSLFVSRRYAEGGEHAARFERAGCALRIESDSLTPELLRAAIDRALRDDVLQQNARRIGLAFAQLHGLSTAADIVEGLPQACDRIS